jgi:hypothetical protein
MLGFSFRRGMSETGLIRSRNKQFSEAKKKKEKKNYIQQENQGSNKVKNK